MNLEDASITVSEPPPVRLALPPAPAALDSHGWQRPAARHVIYLYDPVTKETIRRVMGTDDHLGAVVD